MFVKDGLGSKFIALLVTLLVCGCAVHNPNPGENDADTLISQKKYTEALAIIEPAAERNFPWAMLRLGIAYEYGQGKTQNYDMALSWYRKTAISTEDSAWADGLILLSGGDKGFFNRNNDAKVAQYLVARMYSEDRQGMKKNIAEAWLWAKYVHEKSEQADILFCCENSKLDRRDIEFTRIDALLKKIEAELTPDQLKLLREISVTWKPQNP